MNKCDHVLDYNETHCVHCGLSADAIELEQQNAALKALLREHVRKIYYTTKDGDTKYCCCECGAKWKNDNEVHDKDCRYIAAMGVGNG